MAAQISPSSDARSLHDIALQAQSDVMKLAAGLAHAGANTQATGQLQHVGEMLGDVVRLLGAGGIGNAPGEPGPGGPPPAGPEQPQANEMPVGAAPMHAAPPAGPSGATPPAGTAPAHGQVMTATQHLQAAMQASKAAANAHAALATTAPVAAK